MPSFAELPPSISPLVRLAAIVAVTGSHSLLLVGSPGCGKTMLARRAVAVLPALDGEAEHEQLAALRLHNPDHEPHGATRPPLRAPHHTVSLAGMVGTRRGRPQTEMLAAGEHGPVYRSPPRPGELGLAHGGVLFLDELPEFSRNVLDTVGETMRTRQVVHVMADGVVTWPARFALLAAMNPCPCGYLGHPDRACIDPPASIARYLARADAMRFELVIDMQGDDAIRPNLGLADDDTIRGAVAAARRELARLGRAPSIAETLLALGYARPEPLADALTARAIDRDLEIAARSKARRAEVGGL